MKIKTVDVFISYAWKDEETVLPTVNMLVKCGIKVNIDRSLSPKWAGLALFTKLKQTMSMGENPCAVIFISQSAIDSPSVEKEVIKLLELRGEGARIIPVLLDSFANLDLSKQLEKLLLDGSGSRSILNLRNDEILLRDLVRSIFNHYQLDQEESIVFHAGHRMAYNSMMEIPGEWESKFLLDFRSEVNHDGNYTYFPTKKQWNEMLEALNLIKNALDNLNEILFLGKTPIGFGTLIAQPWGRGSNSILKTWNEFNEEIWQCVYDLNFDENLENIFEIEEINPENNVANVFIGAQDHIFQDVKNFAKEDTAIYKLRTPDPIDQNNVNDIMNGAIKFLREISGTSKEINLFFGLPLGLVALLSWNIKSLGTINIFDYNKNRSPNYFLISKLK